MIMPTESERKLALYVRVIVPTIGLAGALLCAGCAVYYFSIGDSRLGWTGVIVALIGVTAIPLIQYGYRKKNWYRLK